MVAIVGAYEAARRPAIAGTAAVLISFLSLKYFAMPYVWVCAAWIGVCGVLFCTLRGAVGKSMVLNLAVVLAVLAASEAYIGFAIFHDGRLRDEAWNGAGHRVKRHIFNDLLGWVPVKGQIVNLKRYYDDKLIFDMWYSIDENGLRISNAMRRSNSTECVLFFVGSFTFGVGVSDAETMPYALGAINKNLYTYNFGYSGYGAHQMLAQIEHGVVEGIVSCDPTHIVYQGIADHVRRAANKTSWTDHNGPRYELDEHKVPVYRGSFAARTFPARVLAQLRKSNIIRLVIASWATQRDVERYTALIEASKEACATRYPRAKFHVLFWDDPRSTSLTSILSQLQALGIDLHLVSDILPGYPGNELEYVLSPYDRHPNALAHQMIAQYLNSRVIDPSR